MKTQKDIFAAFEEASQRLRVQPSPQSWQKLENRLVKSKRNGRVVVMRWLSAVAASLVLLAGIYYVGKVSSGQNLAFEQEPSPKFLEELVNTEGCNPYCLILEGRNELPEYYANPVRK